MIVLHVLPTLNPKAGGLCQAVRNIIKYSTSTEIHHEVLCLDDPDDFIEKDDFRVHALGKGKTAWHYHTRLKIWLQQHLKNYGSIIVHGLWQYQNLAVYDSWQKMKDTGTQLFVMPHGMLDPYFQKAKGRKLKALRNRVFWQFTERQLVNRANALLFTCETERKLAREPFSPYTPQRECVVGLGVERPPVFEIHMSREFNRLCARDLNKEYFLFLGRIDPKKGLDILIKSYLQLKKLRINLPQLIIAGPDLETDFGKEMQQLAEGDTDILFPGMLVGDAKWGAFYGCEAFILSSHQENFGIAVVEAMACEKPVLISNQVNIYREIETRHAGLVAEDTEMGVFTMLESWLKFSPGKKYAYGVNAKSCYEQYYSENNAGKALMNVLKI